jgi:anti-anti-sigma regulatory factor
MNISISQQQGRVPVTVIHLDGKLDSNSFQRLIDEAKKLYDDGARHLILDMTKLSYISSAGIVALHSIATLFRGEALPNTDAGWNAIRSMEKERVAGMQQQVKLCSVPAEVRSVLDVVGFSAFFEMYTDLDQAVASF